MKVIELTKGHVAIVDDEDFERLAQWRWHVCNGYATRTEKGTRTVILMHREVNKTPVGFDTDHVNGNKLDNRRSNLRTATRSQNNANSKKRPKNTTGFKGVFRSTNSKTFQAKIGVNGRQQYIGAFKTPEAAHAAYLEAAKTLFGDFSKS